MKSANTQYNQIRVMLFQVLNTIVPGSTVQFFPTLYASFRFQSNEYLVAYYKT